ncbi:substrate-binding domain-containing protein [Thalassotalea sp. LPB0316]|uniref:substrate-binding domain-containing protein n=1 Tax=Thalassotalea sp. LPB0316 TaxID=2769490 RepID=UPI001868BA25|nr:substrate-binding domain-containing protein [Thalassotalea sp. LPB0316]QOL27129.1 substrate-binding domain-containing protein [Thalassotalea sp. LPB0316]
MNKLFSSLIAVTLVFSSNVLAEVAVIVGASNGNSVAADDVSRIFLGKMKKFGDGSSITPVNLAAGSATRDAFESNALGKSASQVKAYWSKQVFSGKGKPPQELGSDADVVSFVSSTPGAIGYVDAGSVDGSVKVVATF